MKQFKSLTILAALTSLYFSPGYSMYQEEQVKECLDGESRTCLYGRPLDKEKPIHVPESHKLEHCFIGRETCIKGKFTLHQGTAFGYHSSQEKSGFQKESKVEGYSKFSCIPDNSGAKYDDLVMNTHKFKDAGYNPVTNNCCTNSALLIENSTLQPPDKSGPQGLINFDFCHANKSIGVGKIDYCRNTLPSFI